jgi:uncharacterized protein YecE (DUF72 family)
MTRADDRLVRESKAQRAAARIGTAGWTIPKPHAGAFPSEGSHLARYAQRFNAVEINTSFHRPHRTTTYARWAATVPPDFAFAVKLPRTITHERRLIAAEREVEDFLAQAGGLGEKLAVLLVQLPPRLAFEAADATRFFTALRSRYDGDVALEPRHAGWFTPQVEALLIEHRIARVAADPAVVPAAAAPGGWAGLSYVRLHGTPRVYYSTYPQDALARYAAALRQAPGRAWCIFDNTVAGAAAINALDVVAMLV